MRLKYLIIIGIVAAILFIVGILVTIFNQPGRGSKQAILPSPLPSVDLLIPASFPTSSSSTEDINPAWGGVEPESYQKAEQQFVDTTPLLQAIPLNNPYFRVEYTDEKNIALISKIDDKEYVYTQARDWFGRNGVDLSQINVIYR